MTESEVNVELKKHDRTWADFSAWMCGQTVGVNDDGSVNYYRHDVERFLKFGRAARVDD